MTESLESLGSAYPTKEHRVPDDTHCMKTVAIYGVDHSPWVQSVAMALHYYGVPYRLVSQPTRLRSYWVSGMVMPECRWPDGKVTRDSFEILNEIRRRFQRAHQSGDIQRFQQTRLERLFLTYALERVAGIKVVRFVYEWSRMPSGHGPSLASIFRAFMCLYFLILIGVGRAVAKKRRKTPDAYYGLNSHLQTIGDWLEGRDFFAGDVPGLLDFAVFGQVQSMLSGLTDEVREAITRRPELNAWCQRMRRAVEEYPHDFSIRLEQPNQGPRRASSGDQILFVLALLLFVIASPLTLAALVDAFLRRRRNPNRSGERL